MTTVTPEPAAHTPGQWRSIEEHGAAPGEPLRFCYCAILNDNDEIIASTWANNPNALADAALIAQAPALLAHAEKSLYRLICERDGFYEGCANPDRDIDELRTLIAAAKGEA